MGTPINTYDSTVNLNIAQVPVEIENESPAIYQEFLDIHNALERIVAAFTDGTNGMPHDSLQGITPDDHHAEVHSHASHTGIGPNDHHSQVHDFFGDDHSNKRTAITTVVDMTTAIGNIIVCNNIGAITITLHTLQVSDPVTIIRANTGTVTIDGDGALINGSATYVIPAIDDVADLIGTTIGWRLK